jgi:peptidoglycan/LPS O-acetylase OafA/YrhL
MLSYRKELDGLRALAVVAVIVYHANLKLFGVQLFQGGFFGVDVFFVLSGYLITGIIRHQMEQGTFSFRDFYWRRAKRIVPALLTMLLITSGLAYLILLPDDLVTYARSLQSALYFGSNYFFYGEDSYTAAASIYRPLLHTWSLSVEWQFYVVFPFIVWGVNRFFPRYLFGILLALALLSLQVSSFLVKVNPDMAFYLLPTRAWELILGGLVTFYNRASIEDTVKGSLASIAYQSLPIIGLFLVVHSMVFIGHEVQHPSFITLLPVLGTCLFIMFSHKGEVSNDVMSFKPVVGIGLISYSLYLWHQPIFVFFRFIKHDYFRYEQFFLLVLISLSLSICSYFFVEKAFRKKESSIINWICLVSTLVICMSFSVLVPQKGGFPQRLGEAATAFNDLSDNKKFKLNNIRCHNADLSNRCSVTGKGRNIILIGDSHAGALGRHLSLLSINNGWSYEQLTSNGCTQLDVVTRFSENKHGKTIESRKCSERSKSVSHYIEDSNTPRSTIVFLARLPLYLSGERFNNTIGGIEPGFPGWVTSNEGKSPSRSISDKLSLWSSLGHEIVLVYPVPEVGWHVPKLVQKELAKSILPSQKATKYGEFSISTPYDIYVKRTDKAYKALDGVSGSKIRRIYPSDVFCASGSCSAKGKKHLYYYDDDHLSTHGAKLLVDEIAKNLP